VSDIWRKYKEKIIDTLGSDLTKSLAHQKGAGSPRCVTIKQLHTCACEASTVHAAFQHAKSGSSDRSSEEYCGSCVEAWTSSEVKEFD
jgi:hypothetical protein